MKILRQFLKYHRFSSNIAELSTFDSQPMYYLDANSSATLRPEVAVRITELLQAAPQATNPSSVHRNGQFARRLVRESREAILDLLELSAASCQVVFTSGGTESCASLVHGYLEGAAPESLELVSTAVEHAAMLESLRSWERRGAKLTLNPTDRLGSLDSDRLVESVSASTSLVSFMAANNETGIIFPVVEIVRRLRESTYSGPIVVDTTQAIGKSNLSIKELFEVGTSAVIISGHKLGAPTGIGAFILNTDPKGVCFQFAPLLRGGAQELGYRAGTENLLGIVGLGEAARAISVGGEAEQARLFAVRNQLWDSLSTRSPWLERITPFESSCSLSNTLFIRTPGVRGDDAVVALDLAGVSCSTGAACSSGKQSISHVVEAMGYSGARAREFLRLSLDWQFCESDVGPASGLISEVLERVRMLAEPELSLEPEARI